jgi:DNA-binding MarR family transcriptional regulator
MARTRDFDVGDFARTIGRLTRRLRTAAAQHELSLTESAVLARLDRDGPATTAELARAERGLIERRPHPSDGRQVNITLTDKGTVVRSSTLDLKRAWLAQVTASLDEEERRILSRAGHILERLLGP